MINGYNSGDFYLQFAKDAGLAPLSATKKSHPIERDGCKAIVLGIQYGKQPASIARDTPPVILPDGSALYLSVSKAKSLYQAHKDTYADFWYWITHYYAETRGLVKEAKTDFGWRRIGRKQVD